MGLGLVQDDAEAAPAQRVQALPPSSDYPAGRCNLVLVHDNAQELLVGYLFHPFDLQLRKWLGYQVAQIRLIFQLMGVPTGHGLFGRPLAYIEWFRKPRPRHVHDPINMYMTTRMMNSDGTRQGEIIELSTVARHIQLVPSFGKDVAPGLNHNTSMEVPGLVYSINCFASKEIYQAVW